METIYTRKSHIKSWKVVITKSSTYQRTKTNQIYNGSISISHCYKALLLVRSSEPCIALLSLYCSSSCSSASSTSYAWRFYSFFSSTYLLFSSLTASGNCLHGETSLQVTLFYEKLHSTCSFPVFPTQISSFSISVKDQRNIINKIIKLIELTSSSKKEE